ncbi:hypothetical protein [Alkalicoccus chagannorensis]|uniref:hypothetical protein n=1 Tax=Alkalicoccus chagannorensis TaxID=427072 RepID=UPI0003FB9263|nr:hypothetical protein [Alkalicoccus chagannorensis]
MDKRKKWLWFLGAVLLTLFLLAPLRSALGIPGFDALLTTVFGGNTMLAVLFSLALVLILVLPLIRRSKKTEPSSFKET